MDGDFQGPAYCSSTRLASRSARLWAAPVRPLCPEYLSISPARPGCSPYALGYLARAEPEERQIERVVERPQARKRSHGGAREIGRVRLGGFLVRLGRHGECQPSAAVRLHADVFPHKRLRLAAAKECIAHDADKGDIQLPAAIGLGLRFEVAATPDPGLGGRGLDGGNDGFRQRNGLARSARLFSLPAWRASCRSFIVVFRGINSFR